MIYRASRGAHGYILPRTYNVQSGLKLELMPKHLNLPDLPEASSLKGKVTYGAVPVIGVLMLLTYPLIDGPTPAPHRPSASPAVRQVTPVSLVEKGSTTSKSDGSNNSSPSAAQSDSQPIGSAQSTQTRSSAAASATHQTPVSATLPTGGLGGGSPVSGDTAPVTTPPSSSPPQSSGGGSSTLPALPSLGSLPGATIPQPGVDVIPSPLGL